MIPIEKYGIRLLPLEKKHLELVRIWRNSPHVQRNFEFQEEIDGERQLGWFTRLDQESNWYWIIETGEDLIGVVHIKDVNFTTKTGEAGVFIGDERYLNSPEPVFAVLAMMDFAFLEQEFKSLRAKIHQDRQKIIGFNLSLGYQKVKGGHGKSKFRYYDCTKKAYMSGKMRKNIEFQEK